MTRSRSPGRQRDAQRALRRAAARRATCSSGRGASSSIAGACSRPSPPRRCFSSATSSTTRRSDRCRSRGRASSGRSTSRILITHVVLAATVLPLAIVTLSRGLQGALRPAPGHRPLDASDLALRVGDGRPGLRPALSADLAAVTAIYWRGYGQKSSAARSRRSLRCSSLSGLAGRAGSGPAGPRRRPRPRRGWPASQGRHGAGGEPQLRHDQLHGHD